jgi:hypothetical protein
MDDKIQRLRDEARRLAQGKPHPSQVRYSDRFRRAAVGWPRSRPSPLPIGVARSRTCSSLRASATCYTRRSEARLRPWEAPSRRSAI